MKVYLSYTTDSENLAQRIKEILESQSIQVWLSSESISPGESWTDSISRAIESSDVVVPILSKTSYASTGLISEIALALSSHREGKLKRIIPILADKDAEIPFFLKDIQYLDLSNKALYQENLVKLVNVLKTDISIGQPDEETQIQSSIKYLEANITALQSEMLESERKRFRFITRITAFLSSFIITLTALFAIWHIVNIQGKWPTYILVLFVVIIFVLFIITVILLQRSRKVKSKGITKLQKWKLWENAKEVKLPDATYDSSIAIQRAIEQLRQERETFDQLKKNSMRWFILQLVMGYISIIILGGLAFFAGWVLYHHYEFSNGIITLASGALFVDGIGLVAAVWKIVLNPKFYAPLSPVTSEEIPSIRHD